MMFIKSTDRLRPDRTGKSAVKARLDLEKFSPSFRELCAKLHALAPSRYGRGRFWVGRLWRGEAPRTRAIQGGGHERGPWVGKYEGAKLHALRPSKGVDLRGGLRNIIYDGAKLHAPLLRKPLPGGSCLSVSQTVALRVSNSLFSPHKVKVEIVLLWSRGRSSSRGLFRRVFKQVFLSSFL